MSRQKTPPMSRPPKSKDGQPMAVFSMKTKTYSKADFSRFKEKCLEFQKEWGLSDWTLFFEHKQLTDQYANSETFHKGRNAVLRMTLKVEQSDESNETPERLAKHEMLHVMIADFSFLATCRYGVLESDLITSEEALVIRLEKIIK